MLKIYLTSCLIWFVILMSEGLLYKKEFVKARDKIRKATNDESKISSNFTTAITYLLISLIPVYRFMVLIAKLYMTIYPEKMIKEIKKREKEKEKK